MNPAAEFAALVEDNIHRASHDATLARLSLEWMLYAGGKYGYSYNFTWLGRPIIQYPQDTVGLQEIIWQVRPDLIIETGIAHGGSLILSASMLALLDYCDAVQNKSTLDPAACVRKVIGVDIDIRAHNRTAIEAHPMSHRIEMIEGSSVAPDVVAEVRRRAASHQRVMVCLDSNHAHAHVLAELEAYAPLVTLGSYCVVLDTIIEDMPAGYFTDRPWDKGNNPKTAVRTYLQDHPEFAQDLRLDHKLQLTVAREGFLKRVTA
jgi:cephalosporin hydroxylase